MPIHVQEPRKDVPEGVELKEKHGSHSAEGAAMPQISTPTTQTAGCIPPEAPVHRGGQGVNGNRGR